MSTRIWELRLNMNRYALSFSLALGISISLIGSILVMMQLDSKISDRHCDKKSRIAFSVLAKQAPKPLPKTPEKPKLQKPKKIKKVEAPKPKPIPKPKTVVAAKKVEPQPEPEVVESAPPPTPTQKTLKQEEAKVSALARAEKEAQIDELKKAFLTMLREKIEANRHYPKRARMRGIEGVVDVAFEVQANGDVLAIDIRSGHRLLGHAVKDAIQKSFPVSIPKPLKSFPMNVTLQIVFKLS